MSIVRNLTAIAILLAAPSAAPAQLPVAPPPRAIKPVSVRELIDQLTRFEFPEFGDEQFPAIRKLEERGFDAVPELIEHCKDQRLTREPGIRVGHLATDILHDLLWWGEDYQTEDLAGEALRIYGGAQLIGEERWLLTHVFPAWRSEPDLRQEGEDPVVLGAPNRAVFHALAARYPHRLAEVYQSVLCKTVVTRPWLGVDEDIERLEIPEYIRKSGLPHDLKVQLLVEGASHKRFSIRVPALQALLSVDSRVGRPQLLATLKSLGADIQGDHYIFAPETKLAFVVAQTDDPECWQVLAAATRRARAPLRTALVAYILPYGAPVPSRSQRAGLLGYWHQFLSDRGKQYDEAPPDKEIRNFAVDSGSLTVGDVAAINAAEMLKLKLPDLDNWGSLRRMLFLARVSDAIDKELAQYRE